MLKVRGNVLKGVSKSMSRALARELPQARQIEGGQKKGRVPRPRAEVDFDLSRSRGRTRSGRSPLREDMVSGSQTRPERRSSLGMALIKIAGGGRTLLPNGESESSRLISRFRTKRSSVGRVSSVVFR